MARGGGAESSRAGFLLPEELFDYGLKARFGRGFDDLTKRTLYPFRVVNPVLCVYKGDEIRGGPFSVANVDGIPIVLTESPSEVDKEGFYRHKSQGFGLRHLTYDVVHALAQAHAPRTANLYTPLILEVGEDFLEIHNQVVAENSWRKPNGKKVRELESALRKVTQGRRIVTEKEIEKMEKAYNVAIKRARRSIDREIDRRVRRRWGGYTSEFHPVLGIKYFSVSQAEIDRLNEIVNLVDSPETPWPMGD